MSSVTAPWGRFRPRGAGQKTKTLCSASLHSVRSKALMQHKRTSTNTTKPPFTRKADLSYNVSCGAANGRCVGGKAPAQACGCWRTCKLPHFCFPYPVYHLPEAVARAFGTFPAPSAGFFPIFPAGGFPPGGRCAIMGRDGKTIRGLSPVREDTLWRNDPLPGPWGP